MKKLSTTDWAFLVIALLYLADLDYSHIRPLQWIVLVTTAVAIVLLGVKILVNRR